MHDLSCLVHVHSTYSDGTATVPELLDAARVAGADVLVLTDHDTLQARRDGWQGWHDGVLLVVGEEVSPRGGHLLALGAPHEIGHDGRGEAELCRAVAAAGGLAIAAHPFSQGSRMSRRIGRPHPWPALDEPCCHGLELWSLTTDVAEAWRSPRQALRELRDPAVAVGAPPAEHLRRWDEIGRTRRVVGVGGLDAHQPGVRVRGRVLGVMRHERWFAFLRTHVLLSGPPSGRPQDDVGAVLAALGEGACYLTRADLGDPTGFSFSAEHADGTVQSMGAERPAGPLRLTAQLPAVADLRLLRDGAQVVRRCGERLALETDQPGVYRLEAWRAARGAEQPWVISNPVYVRGPASCA